MWEYRTQFRTVRVALSCSLEEGRMLQDLSEIACNLDWKGTVSTCVV